MWSYNRMARTMTSSSSSLDIDQSWKYCMNRFIVATSRFCSCCFFLLIFLLVLMKCKFIFKREKDELIMVACTQRQSCPSKLLFWWKFSSFVAFISERLGKDDKLILPSVCSIKRVYAYIVTWRIFYWYWLSSIDNMWLMRISFENVSSWRLFCVPLPAPLLVFCASLPRLAVCFIFWDIILRSKIDFHLKSRINN